MRFFTYLLTLAITSVSLFGINPNMKLISEQPAIMSKLSELPDDFPAIKVDTVNNPADGSIVMECFQVQTPDANYIMILDKEGNPVYFKKQENQGVDFKVQPNGLFSYATRVKLGDKYQAGPLQVQNIYVQHMIMNEKYELIDSIQTDNDYLADMHEFVVLPNGNYLLIAYEHVHIDMSKLIPTGNPNAIVVGTVIQELDKDKNCVYQWRSLDHIPLFASKDDPRKAIFEHVHGNSLYLDKDGNIISSFPTSFEIVKIDMVSGKLIWRLGGDGNQFEITGENEKDKPYYFRMQHDAKRLDNGNLLFYDNGVQKPSGWASRAVEYALDEENKKAELVWEYKHNPPISAYAMGSAQRLKNGNTLIDWGLMFMGFQRAITEVTPDKEMTFGLTLPSLNFSYRAQKLQLPACQPIANVTKYEMAQGNTYLFNDQSGNTDVEIYFEELKGFIYNALSVVKTECAPLYPEFEGEAPIVIPVRYEMIPQMINSHKSEIRIDLNSVPSVVHKNKLNLYYRNEVGTGRFTKLSSTYSESENKISAETENFGEFILGYEREATEILSPRLMTPDNKRQIENNKDVKFVWSATGRYDYFQFQLATDKDFQNIVFDSSNVRKSVLNKMNLQKETEYFWRTKSFYRDLSSEWSSAYSFNLSAPYLAVQFPNGGEEFKKDSSYVIRWNTNVTDSVRVSLYKGDEEVAVINNGFESYFGAITWKVPKTLDNGTDYKVMIKNKRDMSSVSESYFTITGPTSVDDNSLSKLQIYPNPANDFITISFSDLDAKNGNINDYKLKIFDLLGIGIVQISGISTDKVIRMDISKLPAGVYYISLDSNNGLSSIVEKLVKF